MNVPFARPRPLRRPHRRAPPASPAAVRQHANLNPRTLILTAAEREYAADVAGEFARRVPLRNSPTSTGSSARLDEDSVSSTRSSRPAATTSRPVEAVLILLTVFSAFPDDAARELLSFGDLDPSARPTPTPWDLVLADFEAVLRMFLDPATAAAANGATTSTEPFRRWALELSRYSFETGQEVFSKAR